MNKHFVDPMAFKSLNIATWSLGHLKDPKSDFYAAFSEASCYDGYVSAAYLAPAEQIAVHVRRSWIHRTICFDGSSEAGSLRARRSKL